MSSPIPSRCSPCSPRGGRAAGRVRDSKASHLLRQLWDSDALSLSFGSLGVTLLKNVCCGG